MLAQPAHYSEALNEATGFTTRELDAMHRYCLKFRDLVRAGGTPTDQQSANFRQFSAICYAAGVACGP